MFNIVPAENSLGYEEIYLIVNGMEIVPEILV